MVKADEVPQAEEVSQAGAERLCRVCDRSARMASYTLYEMMFKTGEPFVYRLCPECGSMQIDEIPPDLERHYPRNYYSLGGRPRSYFTRWLRAEALKYCAGERSVIGALQVWLDKVPTDDLWLEACKPGLDWRILDVGCGRGDRLRALAMAGFTRLHGVDPFVSQDMQPAPGVTVQRGEIESVVGEFDLIMMHHSLEHVTEPRETVRAAIKLLAPDGMLLIRVPVMGAWAWRTYGIDWLQLDPPRHLTQFSEKGMRALAKSLGLMVSKVVYDSFELQFKSERVRQARLGVAVSNKRFSRKERRVFKKRARELNQARDGDQACFVLVRQT